MADQTRIDPDQVRSVLSLMSASATRFGTAASALIAATQQHEGCWGNDEFGVNFAKGYKPGAEAIVTGANDLKDGLPKIVDGVQKALDALVGTDESNGK